MAKKKSAQNIDSDRLQSLLLYAGIFAFVILVLCGAYFLLPGNSIPTLSDMHSSFFPTITASNTPTPTFIPDYYQTIKRPSYPTSPEQVAQQYYKEYYNYRNYIGKYLDSENREIVPDRYVEINNIYLTNKFYAFLIDKSLSTNLFCAPEITSNIDAQLISKTATSARALVNEFFEKNNEHSNYTKSITIELKLVDGLWKLDNITCPPVGQ